METLAEIEKQIAEHDAEIKTLTAKLWTLTGERTRLKSLAWIEANKVTLDQVELSKGSDLPYFLSTRHFSKWLKAKPDRKRFCEWNGVLCITAECLEGYFPLDGPGRLEDLK